MREKVREKEKQKEKEKQRVHLTTTKTATVSKMQMAKGMGTNTAKSKIMVGRIQRARPNKNMAMKLLINSQMKRQKVRIMDKKMAMLTSMGNKKNSQAMVMRRAF